MTRLTMTLTAVVLAAVLDGHDASRFARNLVRGSRVAQAAGAGYDGTLRGEATFVVDGQPASGKSVAELEAALRAEILSPIVSIAPGGGPMNVTPRSVMARQKSAFSLKKP